MPGIIPMKVIRVGNSSQSRIAQACDRCRSKKIRCDGIRPCCTQCANVGFECRTSDKLSRRAFPRGYTESLEDRVRTLEAEVRELKGLLDEKDEKIDVLSRIHSFSTPPQKDRSPHPSSSSPSSTSAPIPSDAPRSSVPDGEGVILVEHSPSLLKTPTPEAPFTGPSSTRGFSDVFATKLAEQGKSSRFSTQALTSYPPMVAHPHGERPKPPPRLVSDQLINIFFQEWAPLYPVVHRPTILKAYDRYLTDPESLQANQAVITQLNLIFGIAALSSKSRTNQDPVLFERSWYPALESLSGDISLPALQCYVLAQIYCMAKGDYRSLVRYRGLAVGLCQMLGLHQSQTRFALNPLATETRKKVFWCQYGLDRFAAALTGLPVMLRDSDITTEYPADVDDENVTETGFLPALPGESTRLSSALALLGASRILSKVLDLLYPLPVEHEIPVSKLRALADELDGWLRALPPHLKLEFTQDKPSTGITSSRSPLLSMVYYFIRSLIHRPAACFGSPNVASPSILALSDSSKHMIQILQLLDERRLTLSLGINRGELVFLSGLGLLWQNMGLKRDSKLVKESQKLLSVVIDQLELESPPAAAEFSVLANLVTGASGDKRETPSTQPQNAQLPAPTTKASSPKKPLQSLRSRLSTSVTSGKPAKPDSPSRRATIANASPLAPQRQLGSPNQTYHSSQSPQVPNSHHLPSDKRRSVDISVDHNNLNYYPLGPDNVRTMSCSDLPKTSMSTADWEFILSDMDRGHSNIFNGIYGGQECVEDHGPFASLTVGYHHQHSQTGALYTVRPDRQSSQDLSPEAWSASSGELSHGNGTAPQSVLSYSEESLGSVEDASLPPDVGLQHANGLDLADPLKGIMIPAADDDFNDLGLFDGWDNRLVA
ncbi:hypothetical protein VTN77DRAFT_8918 [Rasamsonia byssochlamydoides]|uniref:uncharacterized protein n=1 Tax=Rasamsonia byssochlamydoides TaxID=89139 RepID=UPI00374213D2